MDARDERERELERQFLAVSETKRGSDLFAGDRERAQDELRALETKGGPGPLRSLHED